MTDPHDEAIKERLTRVEKSNEALDKTLREQTVTLVLWTERVSVLNESVKASDLRAVEQGKILTTAVDTMRTTLGGQLGSIDARVQANTTRVEKVEKDIEGLARRVGGLEVSKVSVSWFSVTWRALVAIIGLVVAASAIYNALHTSHVLP